MNSNSIEILVCEEFENQEEMMNLQKSKEKDKSSKL